MRRKSSICKTVLVAAGLILAAGCKPAHQAAEETPAEPEETWVDERGFDPLELPEDKEIVPRTHPQSGIIEGRTERSDVKERSGAGSDQVAIANVPGGVDTVNNQVYRVQLFTSKLFGEARRAVMVAEEIFDRPVFLDYEVPYYKVRVGSFADREEAEEYQLRAQAAGYENAWVVMLTVNVKEAKPVYDDLPAIDADRNPPGEIDPYDEPGPETDDRIEE
jgi:hypothetical protein